MCKQRKTINAMRSANVGWIFTPRPSSTSQSATRWLRRICPTSASPMCAVSSAINSGAKEALGTLIAANYDRSIRRGNHFARQPECSGSLLFEWISVHHCSKIHRRLVQSPIQSRQLPGVVQQRKSGFKGAVSGSLKPTRSWLR